MPKTINKDQAILVIGDIMLDHYVFGDCNRISPEAPIPVVEVKSNTYSLGGAGNVVKNMDALGYKVDILCVVGQDTDAEIISAKLSELNISSDDIVIDAARCTTIKTRVLVNNHQLIRLDKETTKPIDKNIEETLLKKLRSDIKDYKTILISDYGKGLLTDSFLYAIFDMCRKQNIKTIVDPKGVNFEKYKGANIIKPNKKEAIAASGIIINDKESLESACLRIKQLTNCDEVIVTMSEDGIAMYSSNELTVIPTKALDVVDVTGAGDTVLAALGFSIASGNNLYNACSFANHAAAIVVSKVGSATATLAEIEAQFPNK